MVLPPPADTCTTRIYIYFSLRVEDVTKKKITRKGGFFKYRIWLYEFYNI